MPGPLWLAVTGDDQVWVYKDGVEVFYSGVWDEGHWVNLGHTCLLALKAAESGYYYHGVLASSSTGMVTDETWKCSAVHEDGWNLLAFDDSAWLAASVYGANGDSRLQYISPISSGAKWIWAQGAAAGTVYCRKLICGAGACCRL